MYFDMRVKQEEGGLCTAEILQQELNYVVGNPDQETGGTTPYTNMMDKETEKRKKSVRITIKTKKTTTLLAKRRMKTTIRRKRLQILHKTNYGGVDL